MLLRNPYPTIVDILEYTVNNQPSYDNNIYILTTGDELLFICYCFILYFVRILFMILCFVAGEFTGNLSQVDKLWSITPVVYMWILYTHPTVDKSPRLLLMLVLVQLWSLRLTYNFTR